MIYLIMLGSTIANNNGMYVSARSVNEPDARRLNPAALPVITVSMMKSGIINSALSKQLLLQFIQINIQLQNIHDVGSKRSFFDVALH